MKTYKILILVMVLALSGCSKEPNITSDMLDGEIIFDPSLYDSEKYLVSLANPNPSPEEALKPVIITSHGYTATTFEWDEFREYAEAGEDVLVSQVLLGGHGRTYEEFKDSSWKDWQSSITEEYERLVEAGYTNIHLLGSSTSGALYLELLSGPFFNDKPAPGQILLIDPIVIPSNKSLSLVHIVGPMLGYLDTEQTAEEDKVYYHFRPQETLRELQNLINLVRKELESGIVLPTGSSLKIYKSKQDPTADPVSAVLIYKGVKTSSGNKPEIEMINSNLHVFTRLDLRSTTEADKENQRRAFDDILTRVMTY